MVVSSAQRRARPAGRGSQAVAVGATVRSGEPRDKVLAELCDRHAGQLTAIDRLLQDLRGSETRLQAAVDADAAEAAQVGVARRGAEHIQADQAKRLAEAERELRDLLRDREAKEQQLASLDSDLHLLTGQQQASEREAQAVPAASGDESLLRTLRTLEEREQRVRELERQLLDAEDLRVHGSQALRSLLREHEDLSGIQGKYYQSVEQEMLDNQRVSDTLTRQLRELQVVRQSCCEMRRKAHEEKVRGEEYYAQLADVKAGLDTQLRRAQQQLRRAEESYAVATEDMFGPHAEPAQQLVRLEEMMMLRRRGRRSHHDPAQSHSYQPMDGPGVHRRGERARIPGGGRDGEHARVGVFQRRFLLRPRGAGGASRGTADGREVGLEVRRATIRLRRDATQRAEAAGDLLRHDV
eukprot:TRINITY_DN4313_c0_g1_i2.p1 TRINITY_DN4313_c0_g1~~TRINITY_DN4313_c0_g1_i2.p1  ORF type:complete len:411 (+),score=85.91 TRINITY_DN4313_c0_g1_i2:53-1285(+)